MKTFVTGANGIIGSAVVRAAVEAGHEVVGLVRSEWAASAVAAAGASPVFGDLAEPARFLDTVASCEAVVHTAVGQRGQVTETDHRAVAAMLEALADRSATFVLTSGLGVYAGSSADLIDEDTTLDSVIPPQQPRVALERAVLGAAASVRPVIVRPAHVYGHGRAGAFTQLLLRASLEADAGVYIRPGTGWYGAVHSDDLAAAYVAALGSASSGAYNVVSQHIPMRELAGAMGHSIGHRGRVRGLSSDEASAAFGPLAGGLHGSAPVSCLRVVSELEWRATSPSLVHELVRGSLRAVA